MKKVDTSRKPSATMDAVSKVSAWLLKLDCKSESEQSQQWPWQALLDDQEIIASIQNIWDTENCLVKVDRYLKYSDFTKLRKKELLHKKWTENVSEPLLQKFEDKMSRQSSKEIEKRKREQFSLYLKYRNKKGFVALDDYDPSEYDPFFLTKHTDYCKVSVPVLQDPLLEGTQRKLFEMGIVRQCETGRLCSPRELKEALAAELPLLPLGRQRLGAVEWLQVPFSYMASESHQATRRRFIRPPRNQWCYPGSS